MQSGHREIKTKIHSQVFMKRMSMLNIQKSTWQQTMIKLRFIFDVLNDHNIAPQSIVSAKDITALLFWFFCSNKCLMPWLRWRDQNHGINKAHAQSKWPAPSQHFRKFLMKMAYPTNKPPNIKFQSPWKAKSLACSFKFVMASRKWCAKWCSPFPCTELSVLIGPAVTTGSVSKLVELVEKGRVTLMFLRPRISRSFCSMKQSCHNHIERDQKTNRNQPRTHGRNFIKIRKSWNIVAYRRAYVSA